MGSEISIESDSQNSEWTEAEDSRTRVRSSPSKDGGGIEMPESLFNGPSSMLMYQTVVKGYMDIKKDIQLSDKKINEKVNKLVDSSKKQTRDLEMLRRENKRRDGQLKHCFDLLMDKIDSLQDLQNTVSHDKRYEDIQHIQSTRQKSMYQERQRKSYRTTALDTEMTFPEKSSRDSHLARTQGLDDVEYSHSTPDVVMFMKAAEMKPNLGSTAPGLTMPHEEKHSIDTQKMYVSKTEEKMLNSDSDTVSCEESSQLMDNDRIKKKIGFGKNEVPVCLPEEKKKQESHPEGATGTNASGDTPDAEQAGCQADDLGQVVTVYQDFIILVMEATKLMHHLPDIMSEHYTELEHHEQTCKKTAMRLFLKHLKDAESPGKWQQFIEAARREEYYYVADILTGDRLIDVQELKTQKRVIELVAHHVGDQLKPSNILPHLVTGGVITTGDRELVEARETNKGCIEASMLLMDRIFRHKETWYHDFLKVLLENGHQDLVHDVDGDFYKEIGRDPPVSSTVQHSPDQNPGARSGATYYAPRPTASYELGSVTDVEASWAEWAKQECENALLANNTIGKGIYTVLLLDMSASMKDQGLAQMKKAVGDYLDGIGNVATVHGIEENVAIATFGCQTRVLQHLTSNYIDAKEKLDQLHADGPSPLYAGLLMCISALYGKSSVIVADMEVPSRVILFTDGHVTDASVTSGPDDPSGQNQVEVRSKVLNVARQLCSTVKIYCVPVGNTDISLLDEIVEIGNGRILQPEEIPSFSVSFHAFAAAAVIRDKVPSIVGNPEQYKSYIYHLVPEVRFDDLEDVLNMLDAQASGAMKSKLEKYKEYIPDMPPLGKRVRRGPDWSWENQDSEGVGTVIGHGDNGWLWIYWDNNIENKYRYGLNGGFDVIVVDEPRIKGENDFISVGCLVKRGQGWHWGDQDGGEGRIGVVLKVEKNGTIMIRWPNGYCGQYRYGFEGKFDVDLCDPEAGTQQDHMGYYGTTKVEQVDQSILGEATKESFRGFKDKEYPSTGTKAIDPGASVQSIGHVQMQTNQGGQLSQEQLSGNGYQWQWVNASGMLMDFPTDVNKKLEENKKQHPTVMFSMENERYRVSYKKMIMRKIDDTTLGPITIHRKEKQSK